MIIYKIDYFVSKNWTYKILQFDSSYDLFWEHNWSQILSSKIMLLSIVFFNNSMYIL